MQNPALTERVERALERSRALMAERERLRSGAKAEREVTEQVLAEVAAWNRRFQLQPRARIDAAWHAIEVSEQYGTLKERTAILLLAEAFFRASESLDGMADAKTAVRLLLNDRRAYGGVKCER